MILELIEEIKKLNPEDLLQRAAQIAAKLSDRCCEICSYDMEKGKLASDELIQLTGGIIKYNLSEYSYNYYHALAGLFGYEAMSINELKVTDLDLFGEDRFKTLIWVSKYYYSDDDRIAKLIDYIITLFRVVDLDPDMEFLDSFIKKINMVLNEEQYDYNEIASKSFEVQSGFSVVDNTLTIGAMIENNSDYSFEMGQVLIGVMDGVDIIFNDARGHYRIDAHSRVPFGANYTLNDNFVPSNVLVTAMPAGVNPGADYTLPHMDIELLNVKYDVKRRKITGIIKNTRQEKIVYGINAVAFNSNREIIGGYTGVHRSGSELDSYFEINALINADELNDLEIRAIAIEPVRE